METIEIVNAISSTIESVGIIGLLIWWIILERKRSNKLADEILEDWQDLRKERLKKADNV